MSDPPYSLCLCHHNNMLLRVQITKEPLRFRLHPNFTSALLDHNIYRRLKVSDDGGYNV
jgi:hypothetical protein